MLNFTRGEWIAASLLLSSILGMLLFSQLYENRATEKYDFSDFKIAATHFAERQQWLEDSMEVARKEEWAKGRKEEWAKGRKGEGGKEYYPKDSSWKKQEKKPQYAIVKLELNICDTSEIVVVPQFGSKRAKKLVEYREKLGGFYSFEQIKEVYILQNIEVEFLKKYFTLDVSLIHKININTATYKELVAHQYIDSYLAKTIINHREKKGKFNNLNELQQATNAYQELMDKLAHYIEF